MGDKFLDTTAYNCALIPAIISFVIATLAICHILLFNLKLTFLRRLDILFCLSDMVQCSTWFIGPKFTASRYTCGMQEYFFQGNLFEQSFKTRLLLICICTCTAVDVLVHTK